MLHWLWYRMTYCLVALVVVPYDTLPTKIQFVVPYDILPGDIHWLWYRITHCQVIYMYISAGKVLCGTTTNVFQLAMCHTVSQPVYFSWQCAMRYHNHCILSGNVSYGITISVFHLAMCYTVPQRNTLVVVPRSTLPAEIHWLWYRITYCQVKYIGCGTA
jgi:hypothetical protein